MRQPQRRRVHARHRGLLLLKHQSRQLLHQLVVAVDFDAEERTALDLYRHLMRCLVVEVLKVVLMHVDNL